LDQNESGRPLLLVVLAQRSGAANFAEAEVDKAKQAYEAVINEVG